jgi:ribulose-bisphosphate carboxylase small chain
MAKASVKATPMVVARDTAFKVWQPVNNKQYETFSYLPALTSEQIARQVDYVINNGWTPCLEFADPKNSFVSNENTVRFSGVASNYYDNRYWTMWKLPMFGCTDPSQVLKEVAAASKAFPKAYIRLVAFDNLKQVQCMGFLVQRPTGAAEYCPIDKRSV